MQDVMDGIPELEPERVEVPHVNGNGRAHNHIDGESPAEECIRTTSIAELLKRHGWKYAGKRGENEDWTRPGKDGGTSADVRKQPDGTEILFVFTSSDPHFEPRKGYNAFQALARLEYGGDESALSVAIKKRRPKRRTASPGPNGPPETGNSAGDSNESRDVPETGHLEFKTISELYEMDTKNDPTCLLGDRFLCECGSMLLIGQTSIGKSSLTAQAALSWALGFDLFGIRPARPLKSVIIQAENDDGDLSEEIQGVLNGLGIADRRAEVDASVVILRETVRTADVFAKYVHSVIRNLKPDLVWLDPLLSFLGGDVSDQETVSRFVRNQLNAIAHECHCAFIAVHHTGKPPKDAPKNKTSSELAYYGIGSSDLSNWARAILVLREVESDLYELRAVKRGKRAGLFETRESNIAGSKAFIRHGETGIFWIAAESAPGQDEVDARDDEANEVLAEMGQTAHRWGAIIEIIKSVLETKTRSTAALFFTKHVKSKLRYSPSTKLYTVCGPKSEAVRNESDLDS